MSVSVAKDPFGGNDSGMWRAIGRIASIFLGAGSWVIVGSKLILDLIGYATAPEDLEVAKSRADQLLGLILAMPWWAVWSFAVTCSLLLILVSWPRPHAAKTGRSHRVPLLGSPTGSDKERIFVGKDVSPKYLAGYYANHTELHANLIVEPYIGKWMTVTGKLEQVSDQEQSIFVVLGPDKKNNKENELFLFLDFGRRWVERLSVLSLGQTVNATGSIAAVNASRLLLSNCELVE